LPNKADILQLSHYVTGRSENSVLIDPANKEASPVPRMKVVKQVIWSTVAFAFIAFMTWRLDLGYLAFVGIAWLMSVSSIMIAGSPSATRFVDQNRLLLAWGGWGTIATGIMVVPISYIYGPSWMMVAEGGGYAPVLGGSLGLVLTGAVILGLPKAIANFQREEAVKAEPRPIEFSGAGECGAALRFIVDHPRALMVMAGPWIVICWGLPWLTYQALLLHWATPEELERAGVPTDSLYELAAIFVAGLLFFVLISIGIPSFAVAWHRYVAGGVPSVRGSLFPGSRAFGYLWRFLVVFNTIISIIVTITFITEEIAPPLALKDELLILLVVYLGALLLLVWVWSPWALTFPSIAVADRQPPNTDLVAVAQALGYGLPLGVGLATIPSLLVYGAVTVATAWFCTERGALVGGVAGFFGFILVFGMTAFLATFLSRAYEAAMRSPPGSTS
jgi:hypothetical protein